MKRIGITGETGGRRSTSVLLTLIAAGVIGLIGFGTAAAVQADSTYGSQYSQGRDKRGADTEGARATREVISTKTALLRGRGPFTHQSSQLYSTSGNQPTCKSGKRWLLSAVWHVRNVSHNSAYIDKVVIRYGAGIRGKSVYLARGDLYNSRGRVWQAGAGEHLAVQSGTNRTRTHYIRKTVSFRNGPVIFKRYATIGNASGEAAWCGGPVALQIQLVPSR